MTTEEIRKKINENNCKIKELTSPELFTLNAAVSSLIEENKKLQQICPHSYINKICEFCGIKEEK